MKELLLLFFTAFKIYAQTTVTLAWDANEDTTVTGLKLYTSTNFFQDALITDLPNTTTFDFSVNSNTTYSIYLTATNAAGLESEPSNKVRFTKFFSNNRTNVFDLSSTVSPIADTNNISVYPTNGIIYGEFPYITYVYTNSIASTKDYFKISTGELTNVVDNYYSITLSFSQPDPPVNLRTVN